nr:cysteine-rich receptor-like protein kinase [Tanacetum cinerariifolium]
ALKPKDKELDDLISSFNRHSQNKSQVLKVAKRRNNGKKTKLYVGKPSFASTSAPIMEGSMASLGVFISSFDAIWVVFGDFNAVRYREERMGCTFNGEEAQSFNDFIARVGLIDLPLGDWDAKAEAGTLNQSEVVKREEWLMDLSHLDHLLREDVKQKCRLRWAVEGDENSRYFHSTLKHNYAKSSINGINVNGVWVVNPDDIKAAALEHFALRFKENIVCMLKFKSFRVRKLSSPDASFLDSPFSINEIKSAVWECDGSKAPGPDGFNFKFIKTYWDVIKDDVVNCVKYFETSGKLAAGCNPSFIVFIRKQILDGCLIANEIIRMAKLEGHKLLLFKVDFEKAFDSVRWSFLQDILRQIGFGAEWRKWIGACLSSALISILINGSPSKEFKMEMGLRQEDHLFPLLFLLVGEVLQVAILEAYNRGLFKGISLSGEGSNLSLLQYADDALFFGEWLSSWNAKNLSIGGRLMLVKLATGLCWVKWDNILFDANLGGLGVGSIGAKNLSLFAKWKLRFLTETNALWRLVIKSFYGDEGGFGSLAYPAGNKGAWSDITNAVLNIEVLFLAFKHSFQLKVFNGSNTLFWKDPWCGNEVRLKDLFPRLYALENDQDCKVKERWRLSDGVWGGGELELAVCSTRASRDVSGLFKVNPLATCVQNSLFYGCELGKHHMWNALVPRKVNICVWCALLNRLPTRSSRFGGKIEVGGVCLRPLTFLLSLLKIFPSGRSDPIVVLRRVRFCMGRFNVRCGLYGSGGTKW